jgi:nucleotide-binding universal stress UspA family protein
MTMTQALALGFLAAWAVSALGLGIVMGRRGYSGFGWGVIGAALGPIGVLLALTFRAAPPPDRWERAGLPSSGPVDVLVGTDGSPASVAAATAAIELLGDRLGKVTLASVAPLDANAEYESRAREVLAETGAALADRLEHHGAVAGEVVLHGRPDEALLSRARDGGYDLIVVGSHGHGASTALLGSVAASLVADADVPLLIGGRRLTSSVEAAKRSAVTTRG